MLPDKTPFLTLLSALFIGVLALSNPFTAQAGCGCEKPPPAPASVRPNVTYGGMPVSLFHAQFQAGVTYNVTFTSMSGQSMTATVQPADRRDLSDGGSKKQLQVTVPNTFPLGPASITVKQAGQTNALLAIPDSAFTVAPKPIVVSDQVGAFSYSKFRAAVGRNGMVYISLDLSNVTQPRTFSAQAKKYPLRFNADNVVFYNTQGFLMQVINQGIPGLASIKPSSTADSDVLNYSRHEFNTHFLQHAEHQPHATDPTDKNWHQDGSRHIDHDHLILAIAGTVNGKIPAPGVTSLFTLGLKLATLFNNGLVGTSSVAMRNDALTTSFRSSNWEFSPATDGQGDVRSNGAIALSQHAIIDGNATAASFSLADFWWITGTKTQTSTPAEFLPVSIPKDVPKLGKIRLDAGASQTLEVGSYQVNGLTIGNGSGLVIDNRNGPVTLYVDGPVDISGSGSITAYDPDPEKFAIYVANNSAVTLSDSGQFYGVLYAPQSLVTLSGWSEIYGGLVGHSMEMLDLSAVYYDITLRGR